MGGISSGKGSGGNREGAGRKRICNCGQCKACKQRPHSRNYYWRHKAKKGPHLPTRKYNFSKKKKTERENKIEEKVGDDFVKGRFYEWDRTD